MILVKYIRLPKRTLIKYDSPYLEPLPEPVISRAEEKKIQWHNMKVKKQKMLEQLKAMEHQRLQKIEVKNIYGIIILIMLLMSNYYGYW